MGINQENAERHDAIAAEAEAKHEAIAAEAEAKHEAVAEEAKNEAIAAEAEQVAIAAEAEAHRVEDVANVSNMEEQLKAWSTQLDDLVASYLKTEAAPHDAYRIRIDALRSLHGAVQTKLNEFKSPPASGDPWGIFHATVSDDLATLESGLKDLSH